MTGNTWKRAGRVFILALVIMIGVAIFGVISVARELSSMTNGTAQYALFGIPAWVGTKSGSASTLQPQVGMVLVFGIPFLAAALTVVISMRSRGRNPGK